ncbi:sugar transporter [Penicillium capsulatum]|nr:sugar transporter [Penicillium capsulatum]
MPRFLGLRGHGLNRAALFGVTMPGVMLFGYNTSLLGGVLTLNNFDHQFPSIDVTDVTANPAEVQHRSTIQGTVMALFAVGGLFGAVSCIGLGDILGRRRVIVVASVVQIIGAVLMASAFDLAQLIVSRVVVGLGTGGLLATVPTWQSEISAADKRGAHVAATGPFVGAGALLALLLDFGMSFAPGSIAWRLPFAIQILLALPAAAFVACLPESPRWLLRQNREAEAREILAALNDVSTDCPKVQAEIEEVQQSLRLAGQVSIGQMFHMGPQRMSHRAMLAIAVMAFIQFTGVNVITFYSMYSRP